MPTLNVAAPELVIDPPGGLPEIEKPVTVRLAPVTYPDAHAVGSDDVRTVGTFIYRGPGGGEEIWDEKQQMWTPAPSDPEALASLTPVPLSLEPGTPAPWKGMLVAAGQKDSSGNPRFVKAQPGSPSYRLRAYAYAVRNGIEHRAIGPASADLQFVSAEDSKRFGAAFDTGRATDAGTARLFLKNSSLSPAGTLEIRATGGQEVEVANCDLSGAVLARITLAASGDIRLEPAPGRSVVLNGPLEAQRVNYQPQAGGARQTL